MVSRYSLEPVKKMAQDVEYQDKFDVGGQLVVVELVELGILVIDDTESDAGRVFIVRRVGAPEGELMKLVCPNDTPITVYNPSVSHNIEDPTKSKAEEALDVIEERTTLLAQMYRDLEAENLELRLQIKGEDE